MTKPNDGGPAFPRTTRGTIEERFWNKVSKQRKGRCWIWAGSRSHGVAGYGKIWVYGKGARGAHRVSWEIHNGDIPKGMCVLHRCDNPPCVNPAHLFLGTKRDNTRDCYAKGRGPDGERSGHTRKSDDDIRLMIKMRQSGATYQAITDKMGSSLTSTWNAINGKSWAYLQKETKCLKSHL